MLTSITGHDSVLLRADDPLIDMNYITSFTGMTDKWFYKLISEGHFPKPIKLGRSSRWYKSEVEQWMQQRIERSRGLQYCSGLVLSVDAIEIIEKSNNLSEVNEVVEVLISIPLVKLYCLVKERSAEMFNFHYNSKLILRLCNIDI